MRDDAPNTHQPRHARTTRADFVKYLAALWVLMLTSNTLTFASDSNTRSPTPGNDQPSTGAMIEHRLEPPPSTQPVIVEAYFHLRNINEIYDETETFDFLERVQANGAHMLGGNGQGPMPRAAVDL